MANRKQMNEFSISLLPDDLVIEQIIAMRDMLPPSPYRDDTPHITLLRGISTSPNLSDRELLDGIKDVIRIETMLPLELKVKDVTNKSNQFYSESGLILVEPSDELLALRRETILSLSAAGYEIESSEVSSYTPHITIRLGVKLEGPILDKTIGLFQNKSIRFNKWSLFRLVLKDGSRQIREL